LPIGFIEVAFTQNLYSIPNAPENTSCVTKENSLPLLPPVQLKLDKPASVEVSVNVTVKGEDLQCELFILHH